MAATLTQFKLVLYAYKSTERCSCHLGGTITVHTEGCVEYFVIVHVYP